VRGVGGVHCIHLARNEVQCCDHGKDDKLAQAILLHVSAPVSHIQGFSYTKEFWLSLRK